MSEGLKHLLNTAVSELIILIRVLYIYQFVEEATVTHKSYCAACETDLCEYC